jgi:crotonobetainyl-CoA:carnitine CoA-transferase CaiB-like acyl-CoA transferase
VNDGKAKAPLDGLRVLDMTRVIAGPLGVQILGDLGADVIKIERTGEGDDVRKVGPPWMKDKSGDELEESTYFQAVNRNKRSVTIDFAQPEGTELVRRLAAKSDVIVENYRPGTLARYGLGYEQLSKINPRLIYCAITGFGQTGPYANRSGYDYLVQGMSGLMSVTGAPDDEPGGGPVRVGIPISDILAGANVALGVLAALQYRASSGEGQMVDISLLDSQVAVMLNAASAWLNAGALLGRTGNDHPSAAPYGVYECSDGYLIIATFNDREFRRLAEVLGRPEWIDDPRFAKNGDRVANRPAIKQAVQDVVIGKTRAEWIDILNEAKVSCGPINNLPEVMEDPQVLAREMIVAMEHPVLGEIKTIGSPYKLSASPPTYRRPPPLMGEQTEEVLGELLGLSRDEVAGLRARGAV